jgi:hypothetical protein
MPDNGEYNESVIVTNLSRIALNRWFFWGGEAKFRIHATQRVEFVFYVSIFTLLDNRLEVNDPELKDSRNYPNWNCSTFLRETAR